MVLAGGEVRDGIMTRSSAEHELVGASASREGVRIAGRENHVLEGGALQSDVWARPRLVEDEIDGVGGAEAVGDGNGNPVGRWWRQARIIGHAGVQDVIDAVEVAGAGRGCHLRTDT